MTMKYMTISSISAGIFLFLIIYLIRKNVITTIKDGLIILFIFGSGYFLGINKEPPDWTGLRGIHDVNTDMENLPMFEALLDAPGRSNSFDYPGETADRQKAKFPWIKPLITDLNPADAYSRATQVASLLEWDVVGENPEAGRFEATDYTKWFNFHDDIVVRITAEGAGSRIDLRSLTRVGGSDHGLGAIRIMKFQEMFTEK